MGFIKLKKDISWSFEYPVPPPFSSGAITSNSLYGTESYIFIGLKKGGFYYFSPKRNMWYRVNYPGSITEKSVYGFEILRDTLYVGTDGGIYIYFVQK
jgi:ligand-binding sensor domain-containing protein